MQTAVLAIHLLTTIALISVILIQRSDSGGIAHLGTAATGGFMSARGAANLLTRTTAVLAGVFMLTSLTLAILASHDDRAKSIL